MRHLSDWVESLSLKCVQDFNVFMVSEDNRIWFTRRNEHSEREIQGLKAISLPSRMVNTLRVVMWWCTTRNRVANVQQGIEQEIKTECESKNVMNLNEKR
jgi:hypothetical protein